MVQAQDAPEGAHSAPEASGHSLVALLGFASAALLALAAMQARGHGDLASFLTLLLAAVVLECASVFFPGHGYVNLGFFACLAALLRSASLYGGAGLPGFGKHGLVAVSQALLIAFASLALGWALAARAWHINPGDALAAWLWSWLENQLAVLMKTLPLGQQAAQRLTSELLPLLQQAQQDAERINPNHLGSAAFGLSLACMAHERQYSRLFRSRFWRST